MRESSPPPPRRSESWLEKPGGKRQPPADLLLAIVEKLPTIVYLYDVQERQSVYQNRPLGELLGYPADVVREQATEDWKRLIHPDDAARFPAHRDRLSELADDDDVLFEYRMRHADGGWRWLLSRDMVFRRDADGRLRHIIGSTADITEQKRAEEALRAQEEHQQWLIHELDHRMKNTLATVQGLAFQTHLAASSPIEFYSAFGTQLTALAATHKALTRESGQSAALLHLVRESLAPYAVEEDPRRTRLDGPPVRIAAGKALTFSMVFHELATNSAKYGALSTPLGHVGVSWQTRGAKGRPGLEIDWQEQGGPEVAPPTRRGFGTQLLERLLGELGGEMSSSYPPGGHVCRLLLPAAPWWSVDAS